MHTQAKCNVINNLHVTECIYLYRLWAWFSFKLRSLCRGGCKQNLLFIYGHIMLAEGYKVGLTEIRVIPTHWAEFQVHRTSLAPVQRCQRVLTEQLQLYIPQQDGSLAMDLHVVMKKSTPPVHKHAGQSHPACPHSSESENQDNLGWKRLSGTSSSFSA